MNVMIDVLTPYPEVAMLLEELLRSVRTVLGDHFVGMYLDGSLTSGDFDQDSDIDFVVVTDIDISGSLFLALQAMHDRIATIDSWCAIQLEGSYISQPALRRYLRSERKYAATSFTRTIHSATGFAVDRGPVYRQRSHGQRLLAEHLRAHLASGCGERLEQRRGY